MSRLCRGKYEREPMMRSGPNSMYQTAFRKLRKNGCGRVHLSAPGEDTRVWYRVKC